MKIPFMPDKKIPYVVLALALPFCGYANATSTTTTSFIGPTLNNQSANPGQAPTTTIQQQYIKPTTLQQPAQVYPGYIEGGVDLYGLNNKYGSWLGEYLDVSKQTDPNDTWLGEVHHQHEFGDSGTFFGLTNIHNWSETWYTSEAVGTSDRSFFWQRYSFNATVYHKMGPQLQFIPYLGVTKYWWRTDSNTTYLNPGFIYYFQQPWVIEAGLMLARSQPGQVDAMYKYIALTQGEEKKHYVTVRVGWGREGYLATGPQDIDENFRSSVVTITWRQWLTCNWGFNLVAETYSARVYNRNGFSLGLFRDI